ncbi:MAG: ATP-binding cassette domain-containing protein [Firmicutes bacterium]|nr:ATP-binding cassette domain-containing protein [Bacillota bacterium]
MLKISKLYKVFHHGEINEKIALQDINLILEPGEFVTVIGGNGAGKSTLLNCIAGVYIPEEGTIFLDGQGITKLPDYRRAASICRIFQDPMIGTAASLTVEENMALAQRRGLRRRLSRAITQNERKQFKTKLAGLELGLEDRLNTPAKLLSGGQRQALALLMATLVRPKLALLDEHTASLDPKTATLVLQLTKTLFEKENITTLMITHNMEQALRLGKRLIMLHEGSIILDVNDGEREGLTVPRLVDLFHGASGEQLQNDRLLLN